MISIQWALSLLKELDQDEVSFRDDKHILSTLAAIIIIIFFVPYTASGFMTCGKLFSTLFGLEYGKAMLLSAAIIVLYTALGGFLAASVTDYLYERTHQRP